MRSDIFLLEPDGILRCISFLDFEWLDHGFGTRAASPPVDVTLRQIHSATVWNATGLYDRQQEGDALVSNQIGLRIGVRTADCVPLLMVDARAHTVAAIHAGWRGTADEIVIHTLNSLHQEFGCNANDIHVAIGPGIRDCCYEVSVDVAKRFAPFFPEWPALRSDRKIDLVEANRRQLLSRGIPAAQIYDSGLCTACSIDKLFSYRREPDNPGRMMASVCRLG